MNRSPYKLTPEIWLDERRAVWLPGEGVLVVSDLHIGYAWAHRHVGQLMPLTVPDDTAARLLTLQREYQPRQVVLLGDVIHRAVPVPALQQQLLELLGQLAMSAPVTIVTGNHDKGLKLLLARTDFAGRMSPCAEIGPYLLCHGDVAPSPEGLTRCARVFMGHEHPAITLSDGLASRVRCPCFLVSEKVVVLPAFSRWAAGAEINGGTFMSSLARQAGFTHAVAIAGDKLLKFPLTTV